MLINNAGLALGRSAIADGNDEDDLRMFETNVLGLVRMTPLVLPHMEDGRGHIVQPRLVGGARGVPAGRDLRRARRRPCSR
jgi:NADP-dependent 3-hydroxy acid dehydrogenase YdfG